MRRAHPFRAAHALARRGRCACARAPVRVRCLCRQLELAGSKPAAHDGRNGTGMLDHVGKRLLHDAVGDKIQPRRQLAPPPTRSSTEARSAGPVEERFQLREPWSRRSGERVAAAAQKTTIRRNSTRASRPELSTTSSAVTELRGPSPRRSRSAHWITITLTLCAMTSCSSRAIRVRSSLTAWWRAPPAHPAVVPPWPRAHVSTCCE